MQRLLPGGCGAFGGTGDGQHLPFLLLGWVVAPLLAENTLLLDAASFALATEVTIYCWAPSDPAAFTCPLLTTQSSEIPECRVVYLKGAAHPLKTSASCIWSGFLYCCFPFSSHMVILKLGINKHLAIDSLRGRKRGDFSTHSEKLVQFQHCSYSRDIGVSCH